MSRRKCESKSVFNAILIVSLSALPQSSIMAKDEESPSVSMVCARSIGVALTTLTETELLNDLAARVSCAVGQNAVEVRFWKNNPMIKGGSVYVTVSTNDGFEVVSKKYPK